MKRNYNFLIEANNKSTSEGNNLLMTSTCTFPYFAHELHPSLHKKRCLRQQNNKSLSITWEKQFLEEFCQLNVDHGTKMG